MTVPLLDFRGTWAKIKAGWKDGPFFKGARHAPNPTGYKQGPTGEAMEAQMTAQYPKSSPFTGKTFSQRK